MNRIRHYFPGGNTPQGFVSYYNHVMPQSAAKRIIVLKGGPGTGKSTLMKKVASKLLGQGYDIEMLHCSSDANSLDGVALQDLRVWVLDGTAPHVVDPITPGAIDEIINLGDYWDDIKISLRKNEIMASSKQISGHFASAYRYLSAAKNLQEQIAYKHILYTNQDGMWEQLHMLFKRLDYDTSIRQGMERKGFISGITPSGLVSYANTYFENAAETYVIHADISYQSGEFFNQLLMHILGHGMDVWSFYCPMSPDVKIEHIYVPQTGQFFTTKNTSHTILNYDGSIDVDLDKYVDTLNLSDCTASDAETYNLLMNCAIASLASAKAEHDILEGFYSPYMDFSHMDDIADGIVEKFLI